MVLIEQLGQEQPMVVLHPYVDNFEFTVYAGTNPAPGARVTLIQELDIKGLDSYFGQSRYETSTKSFKADENGIIRISGADKLPASGNYGVFAAPYDIDNDGLYEYDGSWAEFNLDASIINDEDSLLHFEYDAAGELVVMQTEKAPSVLLSDVESDIEVVYCNIDNLQNLPFDYSDFKIIVMLNRPVKDWTFCLNDGFSKNLAVGVTTSNNYLFTINLVGQLTTWGNNGDKGYTFKVEDTLSYAGSYSEVIYTQNFFIYNPNASVLSAIAPGIDIGDHTSYKVDWNDLLYGGPSPGDPYEKQGLVPRFNLSWPAAEGARSYECWVKDSIFNTTWSEAEDFELTYSDGEYLEGTFSLPGEDSWDYFDMLDTEPFVNKNNIGIAILPINENGESDPSLLNEATFVPLQLTDNWGPEIDPDGPFSGLVNQPFAHVRYDESVQVAFDEPLADTNIVADPLAGQFGATAGSGYFRVDAVRWTDYDLNIGSSGSSLYGSNRLIIEVDLAPEVTTKLAADASSGDRQIKVADILGFRVGEHLAISGGSSMEISGFDETSNTLFLSSQLGGNYDANTPVAMVGPTNIANFNTGNITIGASELARIYANDDTNIDWTGMYLLIGNEANLLEGNRQIGNLNDSIIPIDLTDGTGTGVGVTQLLGPYPSGTFVKEYQAGSGDGIGSADLGTETTEAPLTPSSSSFQVDDQIQGLAQGDWIVLGSYRVKITGITPNQDDGDDYVYTISPPVPENIPGGWNIAEMGHDPDTMVNTTTAMSYPTVMLTGSLRGFDSTVQITIDNGADPPQTLISNVLWVLYDTDQVIGLDKIPTITDSDGIVGAITREEDVLQVKVQDRSGNDSTDTDVDGNGTPDRDEIDGAGNVQ